MEVIWTQRGIKLGRSLSLSLFSSWSMVMSPHPSGQLSKGSRVSTKALHTALKTVKSKVAHLLSEWQGQLLSCLGQLKRMEIWNKDHWKDRKKSWTICKKKKKTDSVIIDDNILKIKLPRALLSPYFLRTRPSPGHGRLPLSLFPPNVAPLGQLQLPRAKQRLWLGDLCRVALSRHYRVCHPY